MDSEKNEEKYCKYQFAYFKSLKLTRYDLYSEEDDYTKPIEHVVNCSPCEGAAEFVLVGNLGQTHDGVSV